MRQRTILRVLVFFTALLLALGLPISTRWNTYDPPTVNASGAGVQAE